MKGFSSQHASLRASPSHVIKRCGPRGRLPPRCTHAQSDERDKHCGHPVFGQTTLSLQCDAGLKGRHTVVPRAQAADLQFSIFDIDGYTEAYRTHQRTVYDFEKWEKHRSTGRWLQHILDLPHSRMLRGMAGPLLYVLGVAVAICLYQAAFQASLLPSILPSLEIKSKELLGLTTFALSLLLVFRTNASYERWDSARKMWGLVLNRSRDLVRQGLVWIPNERVHLRALFCRWVAAFPKVLMAHLRKGEDLAKELEGVLLPREIESVLRATHRPNYVLQVLSEALRAAGLPQAITLAMEQNLTAFEDCLGGCERLLRTPLPLSYAKHTSRFMALWLSVLPFALHATCGWGTVPVCGIVSFLLLGIKEITVTIEEPFSILPLEAISNTALSNIRELQSVHDPAAPGVSGKAEGPLPAYTIVAETAELELGAHANGAYGWSGANGAHVVNGVSSAHGLNGARSQSPAGAV